MGTIVKFDKFATYHYVSLSHCLAGIGTCEEFINYTTDILCTVILAVKSFVFLLFSSANNSTLTIIHGREHVNSIGEVCDNRLFPVSCHQTI